MWLEAAHHHIHRYEITCVEIKQETGVEAGVQVPKQAMVKQHTLAVGRSAGLGSKHLQTASLIAGGASSGLHTADCCQVRSCCSAMSMNI